MGSPLALLAAPALLALALAGCMAPAAPADPLLGSGAAPPGAARWTGGRVEVEVPVPVVLLGFEPGTAQALAALLEPEPVAHAYAHVGRGLPPEPEGPPPSVLPVLGVGAFPRFPMPILPTARYAVRDLTPVLGEVFREVLAASAVGPGVLDANAVEAWLARALPEAGIPLDPGAPALVLLHGGDPGSYAYRATLQEGWLEPVRAFGERGPFLVLDVAAAEDPWVLPPANPLAGPGAPQASEAPYHRPLPAGGEATVEALALAARDATHARLLKGSLYPIATAPCHAVTLVLGIGIGATTEVLPGYAKARDMLDPEGLRRAFENLTGAGTVHVDVKILSLPADDPVLDALSRGNVATLDAVRWWVDTHWDTYWVAREGCEGYVSLLFHQDAADASVVAQGIGTYDPERSHRISVSWISEWLRLATETPGPGPLAPDPSRDPATFMGYLFTHETGHILGQTHTFSAVDADGGVRRVPGFESVWSVMAYQPWGRVNDFGAVDRATWMRNRAAFALAEAMEAGLEAHPEVASALEEMGSYRWEAAGQRLVALLAAQGAPGEAS